VTNGLLSGVKSTVTRDLLNQSNEVESTQSIENWRHINTDITDCVRLGHQQPFSRQVATRSS